MITIGEMMNDESIAELRIYKNLFEIYVKITLMEMQRHGFISQEEYIEICARMAENTDSIQA